MAIQLSETEWLSLIALIGERIAADVNETTGNSLEYLPADVTRLNEYFAEWQQAKAQAAQAAPSS